ncbi:MAG: HAD-IA family hydrolase [Myxococcales bacterium]|nr:HAD-IA family hydrolase [Myxococcales bacterium]
MAARCSLSTSELEARLDRPLWEKVHRGLIRGEGLRAELCRRLGADIPREEFLELWSCHFTVNRPLLPCVEALIGRVKLLLLSNTNDLHWEYLRPKLPLLERFDHLLLSYELGLIKPEPAIYLRALELSRAAPVEAVFFDDLPDYVEAACRVGIHGRLFREPAELCAQLRALGLELPPTAPRTL